MKAGRLLFTMVASMLTLASFAIGQDKELSPVEIEAMEVRRPQILADIAQAQRHIAGMRVKIIGAEATGDENFIRRHQAEITAWEARLEAAKEELALLEKYAPQTADEPEEPTVPTLQPLNAAPVEDDGLIDVGDTLEIIVTEDESFNGMYQVRRGGYVILPQIGRVMVVDKDQKGAEAQIREQLDKELIRNATVLVELPELAPVEEEELRTGDASLVSLDEVYLVGEWEVHDYLKNSPFQRGYGGYAALASVEAQAAEERRGGIARKRAPGLQVLPDGATVVKMVLQWGTTDYADLENVKVLRLVDGKPLQEIVNVKAVLEGDELASDLALQPDDIVIIPKMGDTNRVYITGSVENSDIVLQLPHDEELTAYTAIIRAGGKDRFANLRRVFVMRDLGSGQKTRIDVDIKAVKRGEVPDLVLQANDVIVVPEKFFSF